ncbi:hypothetical protein N1851_022416 [Merluccius polli]|uniref:DDE Tnp4 domain-containing protein n=1 Tax=Merluccius polli TaxID=89951 RepID=A0AA47NYI1_MERPO|nr:hypothetical protein N1851_022416 [Merluccius polli]
MVPIELALCFGQLISKKLLTLSDLNNHIKNFQYKLGDKKNRPHLVPLSFSSHLKDIVQLVVATFHCEQSVAYLEYKISEHRRRYKEVFPDQRIRPKHHFLEHYPEIMKLFGPIVKFWIMRFEAKHSYFKQVVRHTKCFKNITLSLANKHQLMIGYHMHTRSYQRSGFDVTNVSTIPLDVMKEDVSLHLRQKFPDLTTVTLAQSVSSNGIEYRNGIFIVHGSVGGLPEFAEILQGPYSQRILALKFIRFPLDNQQLHRRIKANFMAAGMAGVVGAVDGTHIQIIAPSKDEDVFVNRKKWPAGSIRDPRILMGSGLRREAPCTSWVSCWVTAAIPARRLDTSQSTTGSS